MSDSTEADNLQSAMADLEFVRDGLRTDQRDRAVYIGFAVAATIGFGSMLLRTDFDRSSQPAVVCASLAVIILTTLALTIRATWDAMRAGAYIRVLIEPRFPGLRHASDDLAFNSDKRFTFWITGSGFAYGATYFLLAGAPLVFYGFLIGGSKESGDLHTLAGWIATAVPTALTVLLSIAFSQRTSSQLFGLDPTERWNEVK